MTNAQGQQGFPQINAPISDPRTGKATQPWYQLFIALWNRTGGASGTASSILDQIASDVGSMLFRGASVWEGLEPPTLTPRVLTYQGGASPLLWSSAGTGSVTSVSTGVGLTGGSISTTGTIKMAQMVANTLKGNNTAGTADPADLTTSQTRTMLGITAVGTAAVGQIPGTATNDNAGAGDVGEFNSASLASGSAVSLVTATAKDILTLSLTAGDWDVWGDVNFLPAGTTTISRIAAWVSLATATFPSLPASGVQDINAALTTGAAQILGTGVLRVSLASTTNVHLSALSGFATSTMTAYGIITARRAR